MPFQTAIFAAELLWSPIMRKFPKLKMSLAEGGIGWVPYFLEKADFVYDHHRAWTGADFGDKLPSQVFREHVQTCFIDDSTGLRNREQIGVDTITWECDYPHSDSTWPQSPEVLMKSLEAVGLSDDEIAQGHVGERLPLVPVRPVRAPHPRGVHGRLRCGRRRPTSTPRRASTAASAPSRVSKRSTRTTPPTSCRRTTR